MKINFYIYLMFFGALFVCAQGFAQDDPVMLRHDDGEPNDGLWMNNGRGHAVLFTTPYENWTLSKIAVCGKLNPQADQGLFVLEIWDKNFNLLYSRADNPRSYFSDLMNWAVMDLPNIELSGDFYVCLFELSNIYVGIDLDEPCSQRSFVVSRNPNRIDRWDLPYSMNQTDWTIIALRNSTAPEVNLTLISKDEAVIVEARITNADSDPVRATMRVIDNDSLEVLWTEQRLIEEGEADLTFSWPYKIFQIMNETEVVKPVYVVNTVGIPPDEMPYLAYSANCLLHLEPYRQNIPAVAFFGQDGEFHALVDVSGISHYQSQEIFKVVSPELLYGNYINNNMTISGGKTSLSFFKLNVEEEMVPYPPLMLTRSPLRHFKLRMDKVDATVPGKYKIEVDVEDSAGKIGKSICTNYSREPIR